MKTLSDIFQPGGFHEPTDFIKDSGGVDREMLAYHLLCKLRALDLYGPDSTTRAVELIRDYFEAVTNAEKGKL